MIEVDIKAVKIAILKSIKNIFFKHFGFAYNWSDLLSLSQVCVGGICILFIYIYKG